MPPKISLNAAIKYCCNAAAGKDVTLAEKVAVHDLWFSLSEGTKVVLVNDCFVDGRLTATRYLKLWIEGRYDWSVGCFGCYPPK
jgi:hypothetical protein